MIRTVSVVALALLIASSSGLYKLKYQVQRLDRETRALQVSISKQRQGIRVLEAEWTYLNQPQRIQALAERFLNMKSVAPNQIAAIDEIPLQGAQPPEVEPRVASAPRRPAPASRRITPVLASVHTTALGDER